MTSKQKLEVLTATKEDGVPLRLRCQQCPCATPKNLPLTQHLVSLINEHLICYIAEFGESLEQNDLGNGWYFRRSLRGSVMAQSIPPRLENVSTHTGLRTGVRTQYIMDASPYTINSNLNFDQQLYLTNESARLSAWLSNAGCLSR